MFTNPLPKEIPCPPAPRYGYNLNYNNDLNKWEFIKNVDTEIKENKVLSQIKKFVS